MTTSPILDRLFRLGLTVTVKNDRLIVGPKDRLTDELRRAIRENKPDIIRLLSVKTGTTKGPHRCIDCEHFRQASGSDMAFGRCLSDPWDSFEGQWPFKGHPCKAFIVA